jgi:hypothetical protein
MLVPDQLARALRHLLVTYVIAERHGPCDRNPARRRTMNSSPAALIACESALDPTLEQLTRVLDEYSANVAGPVAEALDRLRSTAADTSVMISAAILETLGPVPPRRRWALAARADLVDAGR